MWFGPVITVIYLLVGLVLLGVNLRPGRRDWMARAGELPDVA